MEKIVGLTLDAERALYHTQNGEILNCTFAGAADGESALKECEDILVQDCRFLLRYPMWHDRRFRLSGSRMADTARAALWYDADGTIENCELGGIKCLRECDRIRISGCRIDSAEFGWKCRNIELLDSQIRSEYFLLDSSDLHLNHVEFSGKYSFQYTRNVLVENCDLNTKDAFWHSQNAVVRNCVVRGEYLGWYSDGLTLENCRIIGTQPLCYCKNLKLIHCTMEETNLSFEYSDVEADVQGNILSVKNPRSGHICADGIGEIIRDDPVMECTCEIKTG